jgi:hypothetical protein
MLQSRFSRWLQLTRDSAFLQETLTLFYLEMSLIKANIYQLTNLFLFPRSTRIYKLINSNRLTGDRFPTLMEVTAATTTKTKTTVTTTTMATTTTTTATTTTTTTTMTAATPVTTTMTTEMTVTRTAMTVTTTPMSATNTTTQKMT